MNMNCRLLSFNPSPEALPAAMKVSPQLLLTEKGLVTVKLGSSEAKSKQLTVYASWTTTTFVDSLDNNHYGIND